jgi:hypothetical protein
MFVSTFLGGRNRGLVDYQFFLFGADERRWRSLVLPCEDDEDARRIADERGGRRLIEIWRGSRFIGRFPKKAKP